MKTTSNQIIIIIVAFLVGIIAASAFTRESDPAEDMNGDETMETITEDGEEVSNPAPANGNTAAPAAAPAKTTTSTPTYTGTCSPSISGSKDNKLNAIVVNWSTCQSDDFQFYKIVKSSKNPNPSYPADPIVVSSSNKDLSNHVDKTVTRSTTYYYRACVVQRLGKVNCGNVVGVTF